MNKEQIKEIIDSGVLLETDSNGKPTQQAKASALDVLVRMSKTTLICEFADLEDWHQVLFRDVVNPTQANNPCAAIYEAAKAIADTTP